MRRGGGKAKGGEFERGISEEISKWWTGGKRSDVFWRTSTSGGRATSRSKKGEKTRYQYGDLTATDPTGNALLRVCIFELKRGYGKDTIQDLLDMKHDGKGNPEFNKWVQKAVRDQQAAKSLAWAIIVRRNSRRAMIFMAHSLVDNLRREGVNFDKVKPLVYLFCRTKGFKQGKYEYLGRDISIVGVPLAKFFEKVSKQNIKNIDRRRRRENGQI